jgi:hypothetical protein
VAVARGQAARAGKQAAVQAGGARGALTSEAGDARGALAAKTAGARRKAVTAGQSAPEPVRQAAAKGAGLARNRRGPLTAATAAVVAAVAFFVIYQRRKR